MINCKESTRLSLKKEQKKISLRERIMLSFHHLMCKYCRIFDRQSAWIARVSSTLHISESFSDEEKAHIEMKMKEFK